MEHNIARGAEQSPDRGVLWAPAGAAWAASWLTFCTTWECGLLRGLDSPQAEHGVHHRQALLPLPQTERLGGKGNIETPLRGRKGGCIAP